MTECGDLQAETPEVSLLPLNEEVKRVEQIVGLNIALHEQSSVPDKGSLCSKPSDTIGNGNGPPLSAQQISNCSTLPSQTGDNTPVVTECTNVTNSCGNVITQNPRLDDQVSSTVSEGQVDSQANAFLEESVEFIDSVRGDSPKLIGAVEARKTDFPSVMWGITHETTECQSFSDRGTPNSAMSVNSVSQREDSVLDAMRSNASSALSFGSNYAWAQEESMGSVVSMDSDTSSGRDKDEFITARESMNSTASSESDRMSGAPTFKPGELMDRLIEGPRITLPPSQLPVTPSYPSPQDGVSSLSSSHSDCDTIGLHNSSNTVNTSNTILAQAVQQNTQPIHAGDQAPCDVQNVQHKTQDNVMQASGVNVEREDAKSGSASAVSTSTASSHSSNQQSTPAASQPDAKPKPTKRTPNDFIFGKVIGEGSYSTVYLAKEVSTQKEFAIKVCDKKHLIRERKTHFVMREKEVLMKLDHPFFIRLAYTFQDPERLYYVLTYARNGELLQYLHKLSAFDVPCTRFYSAEVVLALEYLHGLGIIHRDLKPENILISEDMHIKITDFGTSKILSLDSNGNAENLVEVKRKNSFVGTAEYVSPEVLNNLPANYGSDLWALGCIIYQCLSGSLPFRSGNEYQTFQKIIKVEYDFPEGFHPDARDLVEKLLVFESSKRLGMVPPEGMNALKNHPFYEGIDWAHLPETTPPKLMPYLPATANNPEFWGQEQRTGFDDQRLAEIITGQSADGSMSPELEAVPIMGLSQADEEERTEKLRKQRLENQFHQFVDNNIILRQGFVDKRKGLFARKRMLLLTEGPHLYYVDAHNKVLKGEIPWSKYLRPEAKNFKIFFVHTPNRTYYLESRQPDAQQWVKQIKEVWKRYYGPDKDKK